MQAEKYSDLDLLDLELEKFRELEELNEKLLAEKLKNLNRKPLRKTFEVRAKMMKIGYEGITIADWELFLNGSKEEREKERKIKKSFNCYDLEDLDPRTISEIKYQFYKKYIYFNDIVNDLTDDEVEECILIDKKPNGRNVPWQKHKMENIRVAYMYVFLADFYLKNDFRDMFKKYIKKAIKIHECAETLIFKQIEDRFKLYQAFFCRIRTCPECAWRREQKIYGQATLCLEPLVKEGYVPLFLTLTVINIKFKDHKAALDNFYKAFNYLTRRKEFKQAIHGYFRVLEVTYNVTRDDYHPHFHCILMVKPEYFNKKDKTSKDYIYINHERWRELWAEALGVDYMPQVNIKKIKARSEKELLKALAEVAKYTVKVNDVINAKVLEEFDIMLAYRRLIGMGGVIKAKHKELNLDDPEDGDLENTNNETESNIIQTSAIFRSYDWCYGVNKYLFSFLNLNF